MAIIEAFTDSTPGGDVTTPKTGNMSTAITYGSTGCWLRIRNIGNDPCHVWWRAPGTTDYDLIQLNPAESSDKFISLTLSRTIEYYFDASALKFEVAYFFGTTDITLTSLVTKADIEAELQISLGTGYTDAIVAALCAWAESRLKFKTHRTTFSGYAAYEAKRAIVYMVIERLTISDRSIVTTAIASISENGASINYVNGQTLGGYKIEINSIIADLALLGTPKLDMTFSDPSNTHTRIEGNILY